MSINHHAAEAGTTGKVWNVTLWVLQVAAAADFLLAGGMKLAGAPAMTQLFEAVGVGQWFRFVTGSLEVLGAALLLVPRACGLGALLLACVMVGAVATHLFVIGGSPLMAAALLALCCVIAWGRRGRTSRLLFGGR
jgi:putative oxidoreductase